MARKFGLFISFRANAAQKRWLTANGGTGLMRRMLENARTEQASILTPKPARRKVSPKSA